MGHPGDVFRVLRFRRVMLLNDKPKNRSEEEEVVKKLCSVNGLSYEKIATEGSTIRSLEIFFSGLPRMVGLSCFPNLCQLTIVDQNIKEMEGLDCCPMLQELWIVQCHLTEISGLQSCIQLEKLYLYDNQIQEIKNLELQGNLTVLWLNNNCITELQGLNTMSNLRELNLSDNLIEKIGHNLDPNVNLEILNLSGNKIRSFKELTQLARLPRLRELSLNDPTSALNPVCQLCNYATHILYHVPGLQRLDNWDVSCKQVKDAAESAVMKKLMYYNMRVRSARRKLAETRVALAERKKSLMQLPEERIRTLSHALKSLEQGLSLVPCGPRSSSCKMETEPDGPSDHKDALTDRTDLNADGRDPAVEHKLLLKIEALRERLQRWTRRMDDVQAWYEQELLQSREQTEYLVQFLLMELESVGNIRLEEGCSTDPWYTSCCNLLLSRFSPSDYKSFRITSMKVSRVFRIHNSTLRLCFEEKLHSLLASEESAAVLQNYRRRLEYLFYVADPQKWEKEQTLCVLEEGFKPTHRLKVLERKGAVPLSNSLAVAEQPRIDFVLQQVSQCNVTQMSDKIPFRHGHVIVCKVFVGNSMPIGDEDLGDMRSCSKVCSVYRNLDAKSRSAPGDDRPSSAKTPPGPEGRTPRRRQWFVFDPELVLPEYIIHFEYITANREEQGDVWSAEDAAALSMEPVVKPQPKLPGLDEKTLLSAAGANILSQITVLNLHGNSLSKIKEISSLSALRHLTISFNKFTRLDDVSHMPSLEVLDASFNDIVTLEGLRCLGRLRQLDVSWNKLTRAREDSAVLRKHTPVLLELDTRSNPWSKPEAVRVTILGRVTTLTHLDGVMVTEEEAEEALQMTTVSKINQVKAALLAHSRTVSERPRSLSLLSTAQLLSRLFPAAWGPGRELEPDWTTKITALNLDNQRLSKLSSLNKLVSLRWASFNQNNISKLAGLDACHKLEELSVNHNSISSLTGLTRLQSLRHLSVDGNQLSGLDGLALDQLPALTFLSAESNCITSLNGIRSVRSLLELYVAGNQISTSRDIYHLKGLENLIILDLYGNPIVDKLENYRVYVVFHLPSLKALDGAAVDAGESENAKNMFRGRLTTDTVAEKLGHSNYKEIAYLTLQSCSIRMVDLCPPDLFTNLRSVNLDHNNLTSFSGLIHLPNIKALCLNYNHIESILPKQKTQAHLSSRQILHSKVHSSGYGQQSPSRPNRDSGPASSLEPLMGSLEVLHLSHNGISNMANLQLSRLTNLKALFLQGNEISQVEGLEGLYQLRELVLDGNRIKALGKNSFAAQNVLLELHLASNRIRELNHLDPLTALHKLFLDMNKLQDITELDKLDVLPSLTELSVAGNPVARNSQHRAAVVLRLSQLQVLDGLVVTLEERTRAELSGDQYQSSQHAGAYLPTADIHLPGLLPVWPQTTTGRGGINGGPHNVLLGHDTPPSSAEDNHCTHRHQKHKASNVGRGIQTETNFRQSRKARSNLPTTGALADGSGGCPKQDQDHRNDGKPPPM
ncbi:leucine-rich repeat-containing protein 9 [Fundulus diaphanus]